MERSDKIARSDFGQPKADPKGGIQGCIPQIREPAKISPDSGPSGLHPGYIERL